MRTCESCDAPLTKKPGPGRWPHYCSPECKRAAKRALRTCLVCGGKPDTSRSRYCSVECRRVVAARRARAWRQANPRYRESNYAPRCHVSFQECDVCGALFTSHTKAARTCRLKACQNAAANRRTKAWTAAYFAEHGVSYNWEHYREQRQAARKWDGSRKASYQRRRAQKKSNAHADKVLANEVFERDGWMCGICGLPIDPMIAYPDPMSVSLDHVVPLSLGGEHTMENTRAAHLTCNVKRGNRAA